jgi:bacterioferritin
MQNDTQSTTTPFVADVATLRRRARENIEQGAVTATYRLDAEQVCKVLNDALATEIV